MRLAKSFFLSLIAARMRSKFCCPALNRVPAEFGEVRPEVLQDAFCEYKFIFHLLSRSRNHTITHLSFFLSLTHPPTHPLNSLFDHLSIHLPNHSSIHSLSHSHAHLVDQSIHYSPIQSMTHLIN